LAINPGMNTTILDTNVNGDFSWVFFHGLSRLSFMATITTTSTPSNSKGFDISELLSQAERFKNP
jgi:hypothetical protein